MSEANLKRERFAQSIRQGQREQKIREMREKINSITFSSNSYGLFNELQFDTLKNKCRQLNYSKECIEESFEFLQNKSPIIFMECEDNIEFLREINEMFWRKEIIENWEHNICIRIQEIFKEYIQYIIQMESRQNFTEPYYSEIPEPTLTSILTFINRFSFYHELWPIVTLSKNRALSSMSFHYFNIYVDTNIESLNSQEITSIILALSNYRDALFQEGRDIFPDIVRLADNLCSKYLVRPDDMIKLVDIIFYGISQCPGDAKKLIQYISCETEILTNFLTYLDKRTNPKFLSFDLTTLIVDFISRIFSKLDNETLQEIFRLHPEIIAFIRSWLPIDEKVSIQDLSHFTKKSHNDFNKYKIRLSHSGNKCTKILIFALTNIVVSGDIFVEEIISNSDIWRVLIMLEGIVVEQSVEEIAIFIFNIVSSSSPEIIRILIEQSLADILLSLLKYSNELILIKALSAIILVSKKLVENENECPTESHSNLLVSRAWPYTKQMWSSLLENKGGKILIESLLVNSNAEVAEYSGKAFDLLF